MITNILNNRRSKCSLRLKYIFSSSDCSLSNLLNVLHYEILASEQFKTKPKPLQKQLNREGFFDIVCNFPLGTDKKTDCACSSLISDTKQITELFPQKHIFRSGQFSVYSKILSVWVPSRYFFFDTVLSETDIFCFKFITKN